MGWGHFQLLRNDSLFSPFVQAELFFSGEGGRFVARIFPFLYSNTSQPPLPKSLLFKSVYVPKLALLLSKTTRNFSDSGNKGTDNATNYAIIWLVSLKKKITLHVGHDFRTSLAMKLRRNE